MRQMLYSCDICADEIAQKNVKERVFQVIFTTEQTEGRSCKPYLSQVQLDICPNCMEKILNGEAVYADGAQGCNDYYFKSKE